MIGLSKPVMDGDIWMAHLIACHFFFYVTSIFQTVPSCEVNKPAHQDGLINYLN